MLGKISALSLIALAAVEGGLYWRRNSSRLASWGMLAAGAALFVLLVVTARFGGHLVYELGINVAGAR